MNIAFFTPNMIVGGAETYISKKANWLISQGHNVIVFSENGDYVKELNKDIIHVEIPFLSRPPYSFKKKDMDEILENITNKILQFNIDIVEVHNVNPILYFLLIYDRVKIPFIINFLSERALVHKYIHKFAVSKLSHTNVMYTLTSQMKKRLSEGINKFSNFEVVPIPIETPTSIVSSRCLEPYILTVARLSPEKMYVKHLIEDFGKLATIGDLPDDLCLKIVGNGEFYDDLSQQVDSINKQINSKRVLLLGTVVGEELSVLFQNCSLYIGMGTTILQAASYQKPILLAGVNFEDQPYSWGLWGQNTVDINYIAGNKSRGILKKTYKESIVDFLSLSVKEQNNLGLSSYALFKNYFELESVMSKWIDIYELSISNWKVLDKNIRSLVRPMVYIYRILYRILKK